MMLTAVALADELDAIAGRLRAQKSMPEFTISYENFDDLVFFLVYHIRYDFKSRCVCSHVFRDIGSFDSSVRLSLRRSFNDCKFTIQEPIK